MYMLFSILEPVCNIITKLTWNEISPQYLLSGILLFLGILLLGLFPAVRRRISPGRLAALAFLTAYLFLVFGGTVFCRGTKTAYSYILSPLWSYDEALLQHKKSAGGMILRNCLMLVPLGLLLPLCVKREIGPWLLAALALGVSYSIELLQLLLKKGTFELVDDPINNVLGALLGYGVYTFGRRLFRPVRRRE